MSEIKEKLMELPNEIENIKIGLLGDEEYLNIIQEQMKIFELEQSDDIANAMDENNKPVYSNEAKRKIEFERRKRESAVYKTSEELFKEKSLAIKRMKITLETLYNTQENLRAICRLGEK